MSGRIRPATPADLSAIAAIVAAAYAIYIPRIGREPGPMGDDHAAHMAQDHTHVLEGDGGIEGLVVLVPEADAMLLDNIAVSPQAQGRGAGRALLAFAERHAIAAGCATLRLYTHQAMTENIALYTRLGFVETHRAVEHGFPRVFMAKALGAPP